MKESSPFNDKKSSNACNEGRTIAEDDLSLEELEELSYYDFMGYMNARAPKSLKHVLQVTFFQKGGINENEKQGVYR